VRRFLEGQGGTRWYQGVEEAGGTELIFISVHRGLEGGVNLHVSFATDPSHRRDNGRKLKYCPQVLTLLRRSGYARVRSRAEERTDVVGVPRSLMVVVTPGRGMIPARGSLKLRT